MGDTKMANAFPLDHDLHIHTRLSSCSRHPEQTTENILKYALKLGLGTICVTDHYWDETLPGASGWYEPQNTAHIRQSLPLPQAQGVRFLFGCETELSRDLRVGVSRERFDEFDFVIIPTTHLHMTDFTVTGTETAEERAAVVKPGQIVGFRGGDQAFGFFHRQHILPMKFLHFCSDHIQ